MQFLHIDDGRITDEAGGAVHLRGVNLGGWLMWEGYLLGIPNAAESALRREMLAACGEKKTSIFFDSIVERLLGPADLACVKSLGMNVVRLPFHHRWVEADDGSLIARAVEWAAAEGVYVILDMHAAPGGQNGSWHSDRTGESGLWASDANIEEFLRLWRVLAERYRDEPAVAGYDVMNEPILTDEELPRQDRVYRRVVEEIRAIDDRHIIVLEEDQDRKSFDNFSHQYGENICYSYHTYSQPHETEKRREAYRGIIKTNRVPLYCGEHDIWNLLDEFQRETVHWTWWPYLRSSADLWGHPMVRAGGDLWRDTIRSCWDGPKAKESTAAGFAARIAKLSDDEIRTLASSLASREETEYADRLKRAIAEGRVS
jgi:hypothetical protein